MSPDLLVELELVEPLMVVELEIFYDPERRKFAWQIDGWCHKHHGVTATLTRLPGQHAPLVVARLSDGTTVRVAVGDLGQVKSALPSGS